MKKVIAIAATALLLVTVTGCAGGNSSSAPSPEPTYVAPEPTYSTDDIFISAVRQHDRVLASNFTDYELIELAGNVCTYFDDGGTFVELAAYLVANIDATDEAYSFMGFTIGASIAAYCPEHSSAVS